MADLGPTAAGIEVSVAIPSGTFDPSTIARDAVVSGSVVPSASASDTGALIAHSQSHQDCVVPLEILKMIIEQLPSPLELKKMRVVSKPANDLATPLLFRTAHLGYSHHVIDLAYNVIKYFGQHVLTNVIDPTRYNQMQRKMYNDIVRKKLEPTNRYTHRKKHSTNGHRIRAEKKTEMDDIGRKCEIPISLMNAFNGCPNIQRVIVQARFELKLTDDEMSAVCPFTKSCMLSQEEHRAFYTEPDRVWDTSNAVYSLFNGIMQAMSKSKEAMKELAIRCDTGNVAIDPAAFHMGKREMKLATRTFERLTKLQLTINSSMLQNSSNFDAWRDKRIPGLLSVATDLDTLMLSVEIPESETLPSSPLSEQTTSALKSMLLGCQFPKMKRLFLGGFTTHAVEMIDILESLDKLENLILEGCLLQDGSWVEIADFIRAKAGLVDVSLNELYGDFENSNRMMVWRDHFAQLEHFLQADGPNPFTRDQFGVFRRAINERSPFVKNPPGKDLKVVACQWFGKLAKKKE